MVLTKGHHKFCRYINKKGKTWGGGLLNPSCSRIYHNIQIFVEKRAMQPLWAHTEQIWKEMDRPFSR